MDLHDYFGKALDFIHQWENSFGAFEKDSSLYIEPDILRNSFQEYTQRLTGNYPFFHPRYAGQMLKPPHPVAILGYLTAQLINPNNHALDGGPPTGQMEKEIIPQLASMFRFPEETLGHLTSSGTIANLEALWVARKIHPHKKIAFSEEAHYTHERMCEVLGIETIRIPTDSFGCMDMDALREALRTESIGTVVLTAGTTGIGAVDPIHEVVALKETYDFRIHVDAAYGGFFTLLAWMENPPISPLPFQAIQHCDSIVIDPHKHGLQPYGCGCVLFKDPTVGQFYKHDSPYTYFTSEALHLGEISLECSRAGATAGALWLTLQCLPLEAEKGIGKILQAGLEATKQWATLINKSDVFNLFVPPMLDILTFFPNASHATAIDKTSQALFDYAMNHPTNPIYLSVYRVQNQKLLQHYPEIIIEKPHTRIFRSVLMKPEHSAYIPHLHETLTQYSQEC